MILSLSLVPKHMRVTEDLSRELWVVWVSWDHHSGCGMEAGQHLPLVLHGDGVS